MTKAVVQRKEIQVDSKQNFFQPIGLNLSFYLFILPFEIFSTLQSCPLITLYPFTISFLWGGSSTLSTEYYILGSYNCESESSYFEADKTQRIFVFIFSPIKFCSLLSWACISLVFLECESYSVRRPVFSNKSYVPVTRFFVLFCFTN